MTGNDGEFLHWEWRSGLHQFVHGQYPLEILGHLGEAEDATAGIWTMGAVFVVVVDGLAKLRRDGMSWDLDRGQYAVLDRGLARLRTYDTTKVLLVCAIDRSFPFQLGGPIESAGRLRYIDGCTDTVLVHPWRRGEPCLNHLHIPPGVMQTMHTHPTDRLGAVIAGSGWCETPGQRTRLDAGMVWRIPAGGRHRFITERSSLAIVAFHPDSDVGPTDDDHAMLNRTVVGGVSAKHIPEIRTGVGDAG